MISKEDSLQILEALERYFAEEREREWCGKIPLERRRLSLKKKGKAYKCEKCSGWHLIERAEGL